MTIKGLYKGTFCADEQFCVWIAVVATQIYTRDKITRNYIYALCQSENPGFDTVL